MVGLILFAALFLGIEEAPVERGIVRHQVEVADEIAARSHRFLAGRRAAQHGVADAGITFNEGADAPAGIHQTLEAVANAPAFQSHRADLDCPVAPVG